MKPIKTSRSNFMYKGHPPDVSDLPCERAQVGGGVLDGAIGVFSVWEFTREERAHISRGGNLKLGILGMEPIPPVSLQIVHEGNGRLEEKSSSSTRHETPHEVLEQVMEVGNLGPEARDALRERFGDALLLWMVEISGDLRGEVADEQAKLGKRDYHDVGSEGGEGFS